MSKTAERNRAKELYVNQGMSGIEAAAALNISVTHFYRWVRQYGWKEQKDNKLLERKIILLGLAVSVESAMCDFKNFLAENYPQLAADTEGAMNEFIQSLTTNINSNQ